MKRKKQAFFVQKEKETKREKKKKGHVKVQEPFFSSNSNISNSPDDLYKNREKKKINGKKEAEVHLII